MVIKPKFSEFMVKVVSKRHGNVVEMSPGHALNGFREIHPLLLLFFFFFTQIHFKAHE